MSSSDPRPPQPFRLGFACPWEREPATTWSGTPWNLLQALRRRTDVVDLGVHPASLTRVAYKAAYTRRSQGTWVTTWKHSRVRQHHVARQIRRAASQVPCDAVLQIGDLAALNQPFLLYQDLCYDVLLEAYDDRSGVHHFPGLDRDDLLRCRDRQYEIYARAAGVLAMSHWLARTLITTCGVPAERVHVVPPGMSSPAIAVRRLDDGPRRRLLFVGRDFETKGGDLVVAALARLRAELDPAMTLTVAGPRTWPGPGAVPDGVDYLGPLPAARVRELYVTHDLLVMPSRLEGFGMVFAEALAAGMPCIGRDAYAMTELIVPHENGALVRGEDVDELAGTIAAVLADDGLFETCASQQRAVAEYFTWDRAAADCLDAVDDALGRAPGPPHPLDLARQSPRRPAVAGQAREERSER